jgi:hypothetical protein
MDGQWAALFVPEGRLSLGRFFRACLMAEDVPRRVATIESRAQLVQSSLRDAIIRSGRQAINDLPKFKCRYAAE